MGVNQGMCQIRVTEQHFAVVIFMLKNAVLTFEFVDEILRGDLSNLRAG